MNVEIPQGYRKLEPRELKQEDDLFWAPASKTWIKTHSAGKTAKTLTVIRKIPEENNDPEWGTWWRSLELDRHRE